MRPRDRRPPFAKISELYRVRDAFLFYLILHASRERRPSPKTFSVLCLVAEELLNETGYPPSRRRSLGSLDSVVLPDRNMSSTDVSPPENHFLSYINLRLHHNRHLNYYRRSNSSDHRPVSSYSDLQCLSLYP
ncbi:hypothetical protein AR158_c402R [Paramecium bursaria Chlorella virus AR158]|uniref:hypothetical protein n=1 Tax=Paramecium bursaria Chlorella virus AR158 TaxID=380598 RepID=UPI00015AA6BA|nr:hypothetical protein AR158_c402R [Paramecium bursaria Chlorella virus AR158]ABU43947.1 hypothetical protein AR158_c402R [Paramecium bursaria Chlorella virus AR158]